jgi:mono/diheme cytochrome c family protein
MKSTFAVWTAFVSVVTVSMIAFGCAGTGEEKVADASAPIDYDRQVRPILETNCYECHGPVQVPSGKLHLDSRAGLLEGGRSGQRRP